MSAASTIPAPPSRPSLEQRANDAADRGEAIARRARFTSDVSVAELAVVVWELTTLVRDLAAELARLGRAPMSVTSSRGDSR